MPPRTTSPPRRSPLEATSSRWHPVRIRRLIAITLVGAATALAACGSTAGSKAPAHASTAAPASSTAPDDLATSPSSTSSGHLSSAASKTPRPKVGIRISVRSSQYGRILRDGTDRTIYLFTRDRGTPSTCYGACATAWPPVRTTRAPTAGSGLNGLLLGTTRRRDGTLQVTYGGHPLYYYVSDKAGQVLCQNVEEFGGTWLVVSPRGTAIR